MSTELICLWLSFYWDSVYPVVHVYTVLTGTILYLMYRSENSTVAKSQILKWSFLAFLGYSIFEFFHQQGYRENNFGPYVMLTAIALALSLFHFYSLLQRKKAISPGKHLFFWINSAVLFYFGTTLFLTIFEDLIRFRNDSMMFYMWTIQMIASISFNWLIIIGVWKASKS